MIKPVIRVDDLDDIEEVVRLAFGKLAAVGFFELTNELEAQFQTWNYEPVKTRGLLRRYVVLEERDQG